MMAKNSRPISSEAAAVPDAAIGKHRQAGQSSLRQISLASYARSRFMVPQSARAQETVMAVILPELKARRATL